MLKEKLDGDKIKINWNKNPIKMDLFLSFLTIEVQRSYDHLGSDTGWTRLVNKEAKLVIRGGIVNGIEYLDGIEYGDKLANRYNNYVNPFYLFDILTDEGKVFFTEYYKEDIQKIVANQEYEITCLKNALSIAKKRLKDLESEVILLTVN